MHALHHVSHALEQYVNCSPDAGFVNVLLCVNTEAFLRDHPDSYCIVFYTRLGKVRLTHCLCGIAPMHVLYCVLHAFKQHQADEWLLWERLDVCFLVCSTSIEAMSG